MKFIVTSVYSQLGHTTRRIILTIISSPAFRFGSLYIPPAQPSISLHSCCRQSPPLRWREGAKGAHALFRFAQSFVQKRSTYQGFRVGSISLPPGTCFWPSISLNILRWRGGAWLNMEEAHRRSRLGQQLRSVVRGVKSSTSRPKRQSSTGSTANVFYSIA